MLTQTIPSYLYVQYNDDDDLQAFVREYNRLTQEYVDWFNNVSLPVYTGDLVAGDLLNWVSEGLYDIKRPVLPNGIVHILGAFNTYVLNGLPFNTYRKVAPQTSYVVTDDIFKRVITWALYKGDGKYFTIRWLKRRIYRFLKGVNGTDVDASATPQISVIVDANQQVTIRILRSGRSITGGALFNRFAPNTMAFNSLRTVFNPADNEPLAPILKSAIDSGVLELPFQFTYTVVV